MIQHNFQRPKRTETIRHSGAQFGFVVQTLHHAAGKLLLGPEPVQDQLTMAPQHPRHFLDRLDLLLARVARKPARGGFFSLKRDFYRLPQDGLSVRCFALEFASLRFRFFTARVGNALYIATQPFVVRDLIEQATARPNAKPNVSPDTVAHALVRVRPENWDRVLSAYRLGWAEGNRESCLKNLGPLSGVARAYDEPGQQVLDAAKELYGVRFFCPDGGSYEVDTPSNAVRCSIHSSTETPHQTAAPAETSRIGRLLSELKGLTAALTFTEEGLRAVLLIDRKP